MDSGYQIKYIECYCIIRGKGIVYFQCQDKKNAQFLMDELKKSDNVITCDYEEV